MHIDSALEQKNKYNILSWGMSDHLDFWHVKGGKINRYHGIDGEKSTQIEPHCFVSRILLTNDGSILVATCGEDLITYNTDTGEELKVFKGHTAGILCVEIGSDDLTLISGGHDHTVRVWDLPTGILKATLKGHENSVTAVAISSTGEKIASGSTDATVRIWSLVGLDAEKLMFTLFTLNRYDRRVYSIIFTPGAGQQVISGSGDGRIRVWSVDDDVNIGTIDVGSLGYSLAVNSSGDQLVCGCSDYSVRVYDIKTQKLIRQMDGHDRAVLKVVITPNDQSIISIGSDSHVIKWRMDNGEKLQTFVIGGDAYTFVCSFPSILFYDNGAELKISGRIVIVAPGIVLHTIGPKTRVEIRGKKIIIYRQEVVMGVITASDAAKALEWKNWILAVKHNMSLPREQRARTASAIMTRYKSSWIQVANIIGSKKVNFLPKHAMNLVIHYIYK
jgi:WD40 repeat protein